MYDEVNIGTSKYVLIAFLLILSLIAQRKEHKFPVLKYAIYWMSAFIVLAVLYTSKEYFRDFKSHFLSQLIPGYVIDEGGVIKVSKGENGHFYIYALVNGIRIKFMVDTGATDVVLSINDAKKVGIDIDNLVHNRLYNTANGIIKSALTEVETFQVGDLSFENFTVSVNPQKMGSSLVGMSFLQRFQSYTFQDGVLYLKY